MQGFNRVTIAGNLGRAPEIRTSKGGYAYCHLSLACERHRRNPDGKTERETQWISVTVWGKTAENCTTFLGKGSSVLVEGELQRYKQVDEKGDPIYRMIIEAREVHFLNRRNVPGISALNPSTGPSISELESLDDEETEDLADLAHAN